MDRWPWPASGARQSSASGHSEAQGHRGRGGGGRGKHGGPDSGLTGARKTAEQRCNNGEGGGVEALDASSLRAGREGKEGRGRSGGSRGRQGALYRVRGERGCRVSERNGRWRWSAIMALKAAVFEVESAGE
jgi:hypothetical protein